MDVSLTDLLVCPRCGPTYGLVLVPHESADRRVRSGVLGCANCRERYPIARGVADLRVGAPAGGGEGVGSRCVPSSSERASDAEEPVRLAGLMGLAGARGTVLLAGPAVAHATPLAGLLPDLEVVAVVDGAVEPSSRAGISWVRVTTVLPFRSGALRGVALTGARARLAEEGARVLGGAGRLVLDPAPDARDRLEDAGLVVVAEERGVMVATRPE